MVKNVFVLFLLLVLEFLQIGVEEDVFLLLFVLRALAFLLPVLEGNQNS